MPSSIGHGLAAAAVTRALWPHNQPRRLVLTAVLSAVLLDVDAIGRPFGLGDLMFLGGHRALIHSLPFAALLGTTLVLAFYRRAEFNGMRPRIWIAIVLAVATHGVLTLSRPTAPASCSSRHSAMRGSRRPGCRSEESCPRSLASGCLLFSFWPYCGSGP